MAVQDGLLAGLSRVEEERVIDDVILANVGLHGAAAPPSLRNVLWAQLLFLCGGQGCTRACARLPGSRRRVHGRTGLGRPYTLYCAVRTTVDWHMHYTVNKGPARDADKPYLIARNLKMPLEKFNVRAVVVFFCGGAGLGPGPGPGTGRPFNDGGPLL